MFRPCKRQLMNQYNDLGCVAKSLSAERQCTNGRCAAQFYHFNVFLCALVHGNYFKIEHFLVKIENFKFF